MGEGEPVPVGATSSAAVATDPLVVGVRRDLSPKTHAH
jgi:hypothetical protein